MILRTGPTDCDNMYNYYIFYLAQLQAMYQSFIISTFPINY